MADPSRSKSRLFVDGAKEFLLLCGLGVIVALAMVGLLQLDLVRGIDRYVTDLLMRQLAQDWLIEPPGHPPRVVYIDIDEETCQIWAKDKIGAQDRTPCTLSMITPRDYLMQMVKVLAQLVDRAPEKPRLVILDIELAPIPEQRGQPIPEQGAQPKSVDEKLCTAVVNLAERVPVIAVRPITVGRDPAHQTQELVRAYPSIFDTIFFHPERCGEGDSGFKQAIGNLWFASPELQPDPDGLIRSVHAWDTVMDPYTGDPCRLAGIGFLGARLIALDLDKGKLSSDFPEAKPFAKSCGSRPIVKCGRTDQPDPPSCIQRLLFLLPYQGSMRSPSPVYGYNPSVIDTIGARKVAEADPSVFAGAVVVIGGSYLASGDLHVTPLGDNMPGAMVHANAVRAYASGALVEEHFSLREKALLITGAAFVGAVFHTLVVYLRRRLGAISRYIVGAIISFLGVITAVLAVFWIGVYLSFDTLAQTGTALGTLTPALAVAFEGLCGAFHELRRIGHEEARRGRQRLRRAQYRHHS